MPKSSRWHCLILQTLYHSWQATKGQPPWAISLRLAWLWQTTQSLESLGIFHNDHQGEAFKNIDSPSGPWQRSNHKARAASGNVQHLPWQEPSA